MQTKETIYRDLCIEAGTYTGGEMSADQWYAECGHNISREIERDLEAAALGDVAGIIAIRNAAGLPALA